MSQAEELLATVSEGDVSIALTDPATEPHITIGVDRFITVPQQLKRIGVQHDHDVETVTFDCPRYWDKHDLSKMKIYINYRRPDGYKDSKMVDNVVVEDNIIHFDWTISKHVTEIKGQLSFLVCAKLTDSEGLEKNHWNSELNQDMYISEGLECTEQHVEMYPDVITDVLLRMDTVEKDHYARMSNMEGRTSTASMNKYVKDYIEGNPNTMQSHVDTYMTNNNQVVEHVNNFITENMDSLVQAGLLEINHKAVIEKSSNVYPTVNGNAILDSLKGDSWQKKLTGKNKLPSKLQYTSYKGLTFIINPDRSINVTGTPTEICANSIYGTFNVGAAFPAGSYKISGGVSNTVYIRVRVHNSEGTIIQEVRSKTGPATFNVADGELIHVSLYFNTTSAVNAKFYPMITFASETDPTYEPYCGDIPSPNPEYKQDIRSFGDSGWFDGEWSLGKFVASDGGIQSAASTVLSINPIPCESEDEICITHYGDLKSGDSVTMSISFYNENDTFISRTLSDITSICAVAPYGSKYFLFDLRNSGNNTMPDITKRTTVIINNCENVAIIDEVGKNLLDLSKYSDTRTLYGATFTKEDGEGFKITGTPTDNSYLTNSGNYGKLSKIQKGKYFLSGASTNISLYLVCYKKDGTSFTPTRDNGNGALINIGEDATYYLQAALTTGVTYNEYLRPMLRRCDSNDNPIGDDVWVPCESKKKYVPLDEPLRGIGDVKDEICYRDGLYGVLRRIKRVWDSDLNWVVYTPSLTMTTGAVISTSSFTDRLADGTCKGNVLCSHFDEWPDTSLVIYDNTKYNGKFAIHSAEKYYNYGYLNFPWETLGVTTGCTADELLAAFNTWKAANPFYIDYILATPVFEPFKDQSIFWEFKSFDGATNIYILGDNENLKPVATMLLPKTTDGSIGDHALVAGKKNMADGQLKFTIIDGRLHYQIYTEEV